MKKKQLVAVFVMMLAAATMATACQPTEAKAKDALKYLDEKYSDEQVITLDWSAGSDYDALTYDFLENFKVNNGFEMEVYADEALTDLQDQNALELEEGNNDFWIVVFKAGKTKDDKSAHVFKVNIHKPVTVDVTTVVNGVRTVVASVEENTLVQVPAAPTLSTQESFLGWYRDETFTIPFDQASVESADFELYAKIGEATWTADMKVKLENVEDDGYTLVDGTIDHDFVGVADKSEVTYTIPGFTLDKIEANGDDVTAYYKRNTYTVTLLGADESTPFATIENVKYGAVPDLSAYNITKPDDGETVYTFQKWVTLTDGDIGAVTGTVSYKPVFTSTLRTYTITEEIEGATIEITSESVENYYKSDSVSFRIVLDADYNRSADYTILVNGTAVEAVEGVYTATFPGLENLVVTAEGIEQNTYVATLGATVVNTGAEFAKIKNAEDVVLYVDGEEVAYDDLSAIAIDLKSGAHKIELKVGEEVHYAKELTIEAGQANIDLGSALLGYFNFEGNSGAFYQTADGLVNAIAGQEEYIGQQHFYADIDPTADAFKISATVQNNWDAMPEGKAQETDPGYAFRIDGGGANLEIIFMKTQVRILYSGMQGWAPLNIGKAYDIEDIMSELNGDGVKFGMMKKGNALYFYTNDELQFVFTEEGVTGVAVPIAPAENVVNIIKERIATIFASDDVKAGLYFTMDGAKNQYLPVKVTDASYTDDAKVLAQFNEYGAISFAVDSASTVNARTEASVSIGSDSVIERKLINKGDVNVDLNDYFLIGKSVSLEFAITNADLGALTVYSSTDGGENWDEGTDVTDKILYATITSWKYEFTPEKGKTYKFVVTNTEYQPKTELQFLIKSEDAFVSDVEYSIYRASNDSLVATGKTITIDNAYNGEAALPAGEYYIEIATSGLAFGKKLTFTVEEEMEDTEIEVNLEKNIWGTNFTGVGLGTATFSADTSADNVASTFSLTREGYSAGSGGEWVLDQGLNNGEMISFSLKFNEGMGLYRGANGAYDGEPTFKNTNGQTSDMYIKFYTTKADGTYQNHGIASHGGAWGGTVLNASPFSAKGIEAQYVKENPDLSIVYDFGYAKLNNVVYLFVKYHDVDEWTLVSSNATGADATSIKLGIASMGQFNLNYTLNNFAYLQDADAVQTLYDKNLVTDGPMTGTNGEKTINGDGVVSDKTAGTLAYSIAGDAVIWDTDTVGDVNKGKMTIEGDFSVYGSKHQGGGFVIKQMATGKYMTIMMDYSAESLILSLSGGNGWAMRQYLHNWQDYKKGFVDAQNNLTWGNTTKDAPLTYYMKAELEGYNLKIWVAKNKSTVETNPNFVMNIYEAYKKGNGGGGSQAGFGAEELAAFPFLADVDGNAAQSSKAYESGVVALGYAFCGDNTRGGAISNGSINYFTYDDILNAAKAEAEEAIKAYAQEIEYTLEEGDLDPIGAMTAPSQKAEVIATIKASITEKDAAIDLANAKADALTMLDEYAATKVYAGTEEKVVVEDVMKEKITSATTLDEVAAGFVEAKALVDYFAEKGKEVASTLLTKISAGLASVDAEVAKATEMTDFGKAELDAVVAKAKADINAISSVDDIDNVIAGYVKTVTDSVAKVCANVKVTFTGNEAMDVLYGTALADLTKDAVIPEKADDKDGLGQYVGQWVIEGDALATEDVAVNVIYTYEYYNVTIAGTAVDYAGSAISGVTVTVNHVAGMTFSGVTDAEGKFSIDAKLGSATITWSTPEIKDGDRTTRPDANYVIARTANASTVAEDKDTTKTIDVALAYGISVANVANAVVEKTGAYASEDLSDATYEGYSVSAYGFQSNIHLRTGNVLKENTYFKFRVNLHGAEGEKLAHNVHKSGIYYSGDANAPFGDIALKMIIGGYAAKINGQGGEVVGCDKWQADFVEGQLFTRTGAQPFAGLYETATRGGGPLTAVKADYDVVDMDLMYVKTTDNQVTLYGKLAISDNDWIALATATVKGDWMTLGNASRNSDWYQNFTYENIEYGAIDTETGLPEGEAKQDYNYVGANASAYTDAEGKEHFELNLSGYGNGGNAGHYTNANSGGNGSFAVIYDKTKEYDYQNGRLELEADFTPTSAGGNGAGVGFMLYDADCNDDNPFNADQRMFSILIRANGNAESKDCLMLQIRGGNGSGARIWGTGGAIDRSQYASFSEGFKLPPVWTNGAEPTFKLKYVFDNNTLTTYIDGVEFFKITDVANFIKTELDGDNDATEFTNRYPDGPVHAALFFNHERAYGTDRARVENFKVSYMTNAEALEAEKADAKAELAKYAEEKGVEVVDVMSEKIDAVTVRGGCAAALVEAKSLVDFFAAHPEDAAALLKLIDDSTVAIDTAYAAVDQTALTAKGIEDLNATVAEAKTTINTIDSMDDAEATAAGAIKAVEDKIAQVTGTVAVKFGDNEAIDVKYGTLLSEVSTEGLAPATKDEDEYGTYEFKGWKISDQAITGDITVEAEFTITNKTYALSGVAKDERGNVLADATVTVVVDVQGAMVENTATTDAEGKYTVDVAVGDSTTITVSKRLYETAKVVIDELKTEAFTAQDAVMHWTYDLDEKNLLTIAKDGNNLDITSNGNRNWLWTYTNLAVGEAYSFHFEWTDAQAADNSLYFKMWLGNSGEFNITNWGNGYGGFTKYKLPFDVALGKMVEKHVANTYTYDFAFIRTETKFEMYGKHGGTDYWVKMGDADSSAIVGDVFKFGYSTQAGCKYGCKITDGVKTTDLTTITNKVWDYTGFTSSHGSVGKSDDGTWSLWGNLTGVGDAKADSRNGRAYPVGNFNATTAVAVAEGKMTVGSSHTLDALGVGIRDAAGKEVTIGFYNNSRMAINFGGSNAYGQRIWGLNNTYKGVDYFDATALPKMCTTVGTYFEQTFDYKCELDGTYFTMYINGKKAFAGDIKKIMIENAKAGSENRIGCLPEGEGLRKDTWKDDIHGVYNADNHFKYLWPDAATLQLGINSCHETNAQATRIQAENWKVSTVSYDSLVASAKAEATEIGNAYAETLGYTVTDADLASIGSVARVPGATVAQESARLGEILKLAIAKSYAKAEVAKEYSNVTGANAIIDAMTDYNKVAEVIASAKEKAEYDSN